MSADPSWRNEVERRVEALLKTIAPGDLYTTHPILVTRSITPDIREYDNEEHLGTGRPVLGVKRSSGSGFERDGQETIGRKHVFAIVVYVKGTLHGAPDEVASERLWAALKDVVVCLAQDPTLSGLIDDLMFDEDSVTDEGAIEPLAWCVQEFTATAPGDPDPTKGV